MVGLFSPLDLELNLSPGVLTPPLRCLLVASCNDAQSFKMGAQQFQRYLGTRISVSTARRYTECDGALCLAARERNRHLSPDQPEVEGSAVDPEVGDTLQSEPAAIPVNNIDVLELLEETGVQKPGPGTAPEADPKENLHLPKSPKMWVSADGAMVRLVGGSWREVRILVVGVVQPAPHPKDPERVRTTEQSYYARLCGSAKHFIEEVGEEVIRRKVYKSAITGAGSDGADWCQALFNRWCPRAERILDIYHAGCRIAEFLKAHYHGLPDVAERQRKSTMEKLKERGPAELLNTLRTWSTMEGPGQEAAAKQFAYFESRESLLQYPKMREKGIPFGTGCVESANQPVLHARMKGAGKFWAAENVNSMLVLRCALCSNRWDEEMAAIPAERERQRLLRREARLAGAKK